MSTENATREVPVDSIPTLIPDRYGSASPVAWFGLCVLIVFVVASFKAVMGDALTTSPLYVLPIVACAWYAGRASSVVVAALSVVAYPVLHAWVLDDETLAQALGSAALIAVVAGCAIGLVGRFRRDYEARVEMAEVLQAAFAQVRTLRGSHILCPGCKCVRDGVGNWDPLERWITLKTSASFAHANCPECGTRG